MLATPTGIVMDVALLPAGYWTNVVASLLKRVPSIEVKFSFAGSTMNEVSWVTLKNAPIPTPVIPAGIITAPVQSPPLDTSPSVTPYAALVSLASRGRPVAQT